jgi:hypothetical protein
LAGFALNCLDNVDEIVLQVANNSSFGVPKMKDFVKSPIFIPLLSDLLKKDSALALFIVGLQFDKLFPLLWVTLLQHETLQGQ